MGRSSHGRSIVMALVMAAATIGGPLGESVEAASPPPIPGNLTLTQAALAETLVTADDMPAGMSPGGIGDGSTFPTDQSDFQADGGMGVVEQTWTAATEAPAYIVFDFRFLFPTAEAAQAYLDAAEPVLSESAAGLALVPGGTQVGDGYRHYAAEVQSGDQTVQLQNMLFRDGPVVVKVFVGGYATTEADILPIAQAAVAAIDPVLPRLALMVPTASEGPPSVGALATTMPDGSIHQWAVSATASSQYDVGSWSAQQAAGMPDSLTYGDNESAWAPSQESGTTEWLELTYGQAVVPTAVSVYENDGPGFVTSIEAYDPTSATWITLWQGADPSPQGAIGVFAPTLTPTTVAVDRIRINVDTEAPDWNEVDAVELVGTPPI